MLAQKASPDTRTGLRYIATTQKMKAMPARARAIAGAFTPAAIHLFLVSHRNGRPTRDRFPGCETQYFVLAGLAASTKTRVE